MRYHGAVSEERSISATKGVAALGGALLIAAFFLPAIDVAAGGAAARDMFGVGEIRRQVEANRDLAAVQPLIEPTLQVLERFAATPSLRNLSSVAGTSREFLETASALPIAEAEEMKLAARILGLARLALWLLPLVGAVQVALPAISRLRGFAGFFGLVARFAFGLVFALLALIPVIGVSEAERPFIGPAVWAMLAGGGLMMAASVLGVTRRNWWAVLLADAGVVAALACVLMIVAGMVEGR